MRASLGTRPVVETKVGGASGRSGQTGCFCVLRSECSYVGLFSASVHGIARFDINANQAPSHIAPIGRRSWFREQGEQSRLVGPERAQESFFLQCMDVLEG